jgi:hypothetical protein
MNRNLLLALVFIFSALVMTPIPLFSIILFALACNFSYKAKNELKGNNKIGYYTAGVIYVYTAISLAWIIFAILSHYFISSTN